MAQASSAQREPSMEEILASIRRIIEDSDVEKRRDIDEALPAQVAPANDVMDTLKGIEAFRAEFQEPSPADDAPVSDRVIFRAVDGDMQHSAPIAEMATVVTAAPAEQLAPSEPETGERLAEDGPARDAEPEVTLDAEPIVAELSAVPVDAPLAATQNSAPAEAQSRPSLISEQAGRQVAAAFGELSEAFAASRRRSFDEMAEEMLRPMLQDWLDNNLPHLVERLVREEIERIARG